jgi:hypothetical protein
MTRAATTAPAARARLRTMPSEGPPDDGGGGAPARTNCLEGSVERGCGSGRADDGRAESRSIFASCSVRRASCSSARLISSWACASRSSGPAVAASCGPVSFGGGVEFIGVFLCRPMSSEDGRSTIRPRPTVLSKEWPHDGRAWDRGAIAAPAHRAGSIGALRMNGPEAAGGDYFPPRFLSIVSQIMAATSGPSRR